MRKKYSLKINKELIDLIAEGRDVLVYRVLGQDGLKMFVSKDGKWNFNFEDLNDIDDICYTINFCEKHNLIKVSKNGNVIIPPIATALGEKGKISEKILDHLNFTQELFNEYYGAQLEVKLEFYEFIERGYKTEQQIKDFWQIWLPVIVAIIASVLTGLFTKLFDILL